jgi:hypothetical protein
MRVWAAKLPFGQKAAQGTRDVSCRASLPSLKPHVHLARFQARLHMNEPGAAADGAVLCIRLPLAAALVHVQLFGLSAKWARHERGGVAGAALSLHPFTAS